MTTFLEITFSTVAIQRPNMMISVFCLLSFVRGEVTSLMHASLCVYTCVCTYLCVSVQAHVCVCSLWARAVNSPVQTLTRWEGLRSAL